MIRHQVEVFKLRPRHRAGVLASAQPLLNGTPLVRMAVRCKGMARPLVKAQRRAYRG